MCVLEHISSLILHFGIGNSIETFEKFAISLTVFISYTNVSQISYYSEQGGQFGLQELAAGTMHNNHLVMEHETGTKTTLHRAHKYT